MARGGPGADAPLYGPLWGRKSLSPRSIPTGFAPLPSDRPPDPHARQRLLGGVEPAQFLPALDQASHGLPARGHFAARVGPARPPGELRVGDAPRPRLRVPRPLCQEPHPADYAALENGDAIGSRRAIREGAPPGDARVLHLQ